MKRMNRGFVQKTANHLYLLVATAPQAKPVFKTVSKFLEPQRRIRFQIPKLEQIPISNVKLLNYVEFEVYLYLTLKTIFHYFL